MNEDWAIKAVCMKNSASMRQFQEVDQEDLNDKIVKIAHLQADQILDRQHERKRRRAPLRERRDEEMAKIKKILRQYGVEK